MLWAYFDESGEHDKTTGHLTQLTVGGWIAPSDAWKAFDEAWLKALDRAQIPMFHMSDFERYEREFTIEKGWTEEKHRRVLNELLDIIGAHLKNSFAFTNKVFASKPRQHFTDTYENNLIDCLMVLADQTIHSFSFNDRISVVFAKHKDYQKQRIQRIFDFMDYGDVRLGTLAISDPIDVRPLQAADIIAYEIQHLNRDSWRDTPLSLAEVARTWLQNQNFDYRN